MRTPLVLSAFVLTVFVACTDKKSPPPPAPVATEVDAGQTQLTYDILLRVDFNRRAQERLLPFFWRADTNNDKRLSPDELAILWGPYEKKTWVVAGGFTKAFDDAYRSMLLDLPTPTSEAEQRRQYLLKQELTQGVPTLVETDLSKFSPEDRAVAAHLLEVAALIEKLYARENGTHDLEAKIPASDVLSRAVFHRNQSPFCVAPKTENDPGCSALPGTKRVVGLYPADLQGDGKFCEALAATPNGKALADDHFSVVVKEGETYKNVPFTVAFKDDMEAVAKKLDETAAAITSPDEAAFKAYLTAAATSFRTNDWEPSNAAWVAMGPNNSKWFLRVAPDEVYFEPCAWKAGFALQLARINPESLVWQQKLAPVKLDMEKALATLAGPPYKARNVAFKLPDFIDVVANAGDQRNAHGATMGQSLPNWGPVADKGGRTVVMTNLYTDPDSQKQLKFQMASLFCADTMKLATTDAAPNTMNTVLHEASHNLGPAHDYAVAGKKDHDAFGGPLSSTMEELKAQTAALYFTEWLEGRKMISREQADQSQVRAVAWAFGHISRGMYDGADVPKTYSQLAAIQLGWFRKDGVLVWNAEQKAANGADTGCFELKLDAKWKTSLDALAKRVLKVKATADRAGAEALKSEFVDDTGEWKKLRDVITERWLQAPKATFVYAFHE